MSGLINRLSWLLIGFVAATGGFTLVVVAGAALVFHAILPLPTVWLIVAAVAVYLMLRGEPAAPNGRWSSRPSALREKNAPQCSSW